MRDPDYNPIEHQPRAGRGGEVGPNGEFYRAGAWIATKADRPKGLRVVGDQVELDGKPVTPAQRRKVFAELEALGLECRFDKRKGIKEPWYCGWTRDFADGRCRWLENLTFDLRYAPRDGFGYAHHGTGHCRATLAEMVAVALEEARLMDELLTSGQAGWWELDYLYSL